MSKSKLIISLFLLSQAVNTCGVYADSQVPTSSEKHVAQTVVKKNMTAPQPQSVKAISNSAVADINDWQVSLEGTTVKIKDYVRAEGKEVKVPSLADFKTRYPTATAVSITKQAIHESAYTKRATAFICDSPTLCADTDMSKTFGNFSSGNPSLATFDLSGLDTSNVTNVNNMFHNCANLSSLDVSHTLTSAR